MSSTPLLRLPVEMLRNITAYLEIEDQARLSMTNRYLRSTFPAPTHSDFLMAESSEWAVSKQLYTCKGCVRFCGFGKFADYMRKGARARSAPDARSRFCLDCGVEKGWYSEGTSIAIYGSIAVLGRLCSELTDRCGSRISCGSRSLAWTPLRKPKPSEYGNESRREQDDEWAYMSRSRVGTKYAEEEYELWLDI